MTDPTARALMTDPSVKDDLLAALPSLRAFSISLCGRTARAEDLVQETMLAAWLLSQAKIASRLIVRRRRRGASSGANVPRGSGQRRLPRR